MAIRTLMIVPIPGVRPSLHISGGIILTYDDSLAGHVSVALQTALVQLNAPVVAATIDPALLPTQAPPPPQPAVQASFDPTKQSVGHQPTGDFDPRQITPPAANGGTMSVIDGVPALPQPPIAAPPRPPAQFDPTLAVSAPPTGQPHRRTAPIALPNPGPHANRLPQVPGIKPPRFAKPEPEAPQTPAQKILAKLSGLPRGNPGTNRPPQVPTAVPGATPTAAEIVARDGDMAEIAPGQYMGPDGTIWQSATKEKDGRPIVPLPQPPIAAPPMPPGTK